MTITLQYGISRSYERQFAEGTTVRDILMDATVKARLALPESVVATVDGRTLELNDEVTDGDTVLFEKQAAAKAS